MWREVALVLVATAFISGSARPAPTALSERLDRYPESGNPGSEVRWTRSDPFEHDAIIPLHVARDMLGDEGWERCLEVTDDGRLRGVCGLKNGCMTMEVLTNGVAKLKLHPRNCRSERFYDIDEVPADEPWPDPEGVECWRDRIDGVRWLVCSDPGEGRFGVSEP